MIGSGSTSDLFFPVLSLHSLLKSTMILMELFRVKMLLAFFSPQLYSNIKVGISDK